MNMGRFPSFFKIQDLIDRRFKALVRLWSSQWVCLLLPILLKVIEGIDRILHSVPTSPELIFKDRRLFHRQWCYCWAFLTFMMIAVRLLLPFVRFLILLHPALQICVRGQHRLLYTFLTLIQFFFVIGLANGRFFVQNLKFVEIDWDLVLHRGRGTLNFLEFIW